MMWIAYSCMLLQHIAKPLQIKPENSPTSHHQCSSIHRHNLYQIMQEHYNQELSFGVQIRLSITKALLL